MPLQPIAGWRSRSGTGELASPAGCLIAISREGHSKNDYYFRTSAEVVNLKN